MKAMTASSALLVWHSARSLLWHSARTLLGHSARTPGARQSATGRTLLRLDTLPL